MQRTPSHALTTRHHTHTHLTRTTLHLPRNKVIDMFPDSEYIHVGGDEAQQTTPLEYDYYMARVRRLLYCAPPLVHPTTPCSPNHPLFTQPPLVHHQVQSIISSHGRKLLGWQVHYTHSLSFTPLLSHSLSHTPLSHSSPLTISLIHSSHSLLSSHPLLHTPLIHSSPTHSSHTLLSYTPLLHTPLLHTPLLHTPLIHSSHTLLSYTPLTHSSHTLLSHTPLLHSSAVRRLRGRPVYQLTAVMHSRPRYGLRELGAALQRRQKRWWRRVERSAVYIECIQCGIQ
jgi:hypothetical protein